MSDTINTRNQMGIDKALAYAVTFAWEEFRAIKPRSIRVEYLCEPGAALNQLSVWSSRAGGYQDLVFDYGTWTSSAHPNGARTANGHPEGLAQTLDFIMQHQNQFTRPPDAGRHGLVLIYPPEGDDHIEAAAWITGIDILEDEPPGEEAPTRPPKRPQGRSPERSEDHRQDRGLQTSARTVDQPYSGKPVEEAAKTGAADYFALRYAWPE